MVKLQEIAKETLARTLEGLKTKGFDYLKKITAVDFVQYLEVVYILYNTSTFEEEIIKVKLSPDSPEIESVMDIYRAADWYEREMSEMFGIKIKGRNAKKLLLEEWNGTEFPLRKSFQWGKEYKKVEP